MNLELLGRVQKEFSITGYAIHETVLAIAERVNRKVHTLRLHWQIAQVMTRLDQLQIDLGRSMCAAVTSRSQSGTSSVDVQAALDRAVDHIGRLKQIALQLDARIRKLKLEAIPEDLLTLQRELSARGTVIERVPLAQDMRGIGRSFAELGLPESVQPAAVIRGPFVLRPATDLVLREEDIVILIGSAGEIGPATARLTGSVPADSLRRTHAPFVIE